MLSEFVTTIADLGAKAATKEIEVKSIPGVRGRVMVRQPGADKGDWLNLDSPIYRDKVQSLTDLVLAYQNFGEGATIWHHAGGVVIAIDGPRQRTASYQLDVSPAFKKLTELANSSPLTQKALVTILREELRDRVSSSVLDAVRKVEATFGAKKTGEVIHGKERGTHEFVAELANAAAFPEIVKAQVEVYSGVPIEPFTIEILTEVKIDPQNLNFVFKPAPGKLDEAIRDAHSQLGVELRGMLGLDKTVPHKSVIWGVPTLAKE